MRLLAIVASVVAAHAASFQATLTTGGHNPVVNTRWPYAVKVVDGKGEPLRARISVAVVDPLGTAHPTEYYANTKLVQNIPFRGTFRDAVRWPPESKGYPLTFRVTVKVGTAVRVLKYSVVSR
jgi:hypothetical protein